MGLPGRLLTLTLFGCGSESELLVIQPDSGWADGCTEVEVAGRSLADAVVTIGGQALGDPFTLDGRWAGGRTPPGEPGNADVVVTDGGRERKVPGGFTYEACPGARIEGVVDEDGDGSIGSDAWVELRGCGLVEGLGVAVGDAAPAPLSAVCGTAAASFTPPPRVDGLYDLRIVDADGVEVYPGSCTTCSARIRYGLPEPVDTGGSEVDSGDSG